MTWPLSYMFKRTVYHFRLGYTTSVVSPACASPAKLAELRRHKDSDSGASESGCTGATSVAFALVQGRASTVLPGAGADAVPVIKQEPPEPGVVTVKQEPLESDTATAPPAETDTTVVKQELTPPVIVKQEPADPDPAGVKQLDIHQLHAGHCSRSEQWMDQLRAMDRIDGNPSSNCVQCGSKTCHAGRCGALPPFCGEEADTPDYILPHFFDLVRLRPLGTIYLTAEEVRSSELVAAIFPQSHQAT